jgi:zinc transporter 9
MLGEAIHSLCDLGNQAILFQGLREMQMKPDQVHQYGYGRAAFFWGLVSALGTFWLGCGFTCYHGVHSMFHPQEILVTWHVWTVSMQIYIYVWLFLYHASHPTALKVISFISY